MGQLEPKTDVFRDTYVRYLGYANEVGEAFRAIIGNRLTMCSYLIASGYVLADATHKGYETLQLSTADDSRQLPTESGGSSRDWQKASLIAIDALLWQSFASIIVPGFTINRLCKFTSWTLRFATKLPCNQIQWLVTGVGLAAIPIIIKPIDRGTDHLMDATYRRLICV